jgi:hypothetical protein
VLLVRSGSPDNLRNAETLRGFRNVCTVATLTHCTAVQLTGGQWLPLYSDFFQFAAHVADKAGWISKLDGRVTGMNDETDKFVAQCAGQVDLPESFNLSVDPILLKRLLQAWTSYFIVPPKDEALLPLFRSLEVAFQASRFPSDGLVSLSDVGTRIGLWVSAFEVLFHPGGKGKIDEARVLSSLEKVVFSDESLNARSYAVRYKGSPLETCFVGAVYDELYSARNAFMHGNPIDERHVRLHGSGKGPHLLGLAPLLYNVALRAFMTCMFANDEDDDRTDYFLGLGDIEKALVTARG